MKQLELIISKTRSKRKLKKVASAPLADGEWQSGTMYLAVIARGYAVLIPRPALLSLATGEHGFLSTVVIWHVLDYTSDTIK